MKPKELDRFINSLSQLIRNQLSPTPLEVDPFFDRLSQISPDSDIQNEIRMLLECIKIENSASEIQNLTRRSTLHNLPQLLEHLPKTVNTNNTINKTLNDIDIFIRYGHDQPDATPDTSLVKEPVNQDIMQTSLIIGRRLSKL